MAVVASAFLAAFPSFPARAHAQVVSVSPSSGSVLSEPPREVSVTFNEPVTGAVVGLRTGDGVEIAGELVQDGPRVSFVPSAPLADGGYLFVWEAVSSDTHVVSGALSFAVGDGQPPPDAAHAGHGGSRSLRSTHHMLSFAAAAALMVRSPRSRRIVAIVAAVALTAGGARMLVMSELARELASSGVRLQMLSAVLLGAAALSRGVSQKVLGAAGVLTLGSVGLVDGHALALEGVLPRALHASHMAAAALWTGGVLALALEPVRESALRFARVATPSVLLLSAAGLYNAFAMGWPAASQWSSALSVKLSVFFLAATVGLVNHVLLRRGSGPVPRGSIAFEAAALLSVAVLSAGLASSAPPELEGLHAEHGAQVQRFEVEMGEGWVATVSYATPFSGVAEIVTVDVRDPSGSRFEGPAFLSLQDPEGVRLEFDLRVFPDGAFAALVWPPSGDWRAVVEVRADRFSVRRGSWQVEVR